MGAEGSSAAPLLRMAGIEKAFPGVQALKGIDLSIPSGSFYGLLGPNGAGKTTTIGIITGLVKLSSGKVEVMGWDIIDNFRRSRKLIGLASQEYNFDIFFSIEQILKFQAGYYGLSQSEAQDNTNKVLELFGLTEKRGNKPRELSGGMKRRLLIAKAMVHSPPILVLDEPTAGVDVELRRQLWELVTDLNRQGVTVVLTTHYLEEAEQLCDRIAIINHGELIAEKPTRELVGMAREKVVSITVDKDLGGPIMEEAFTKAEVIEPRRLEITYDRDKASAGQVLALVQSHGYAIEDVTTREADLEDVFVQLTGAG